ncbi:two-component regulator propeller domain-containing protein [Wenyingzhuangia sp. IMCC45467]
MRQKFEVFLGCFIVMFTHLLWGQPSGVIKHFSHDQNLSQSRILDIQQDNEGFIWLATFNGLIRYDGSDFRNFKVIRSDSLQLKSNRVFYFEIDKNQKIWIRSENNEIYFFDIKNFTFHSPLEKSNIQNTSVLKDFKILPSGKVWLIPEHKNFLYLYGVKGELQKIDLTEVALKSEDVIDFYEDDFGKIWLLTTSGICRLDGDKIIGDFYFFNKQETNNSSYLFSSVMETKQEIWFGGAQGKIVRYAKKSKTFLDFNINIKGNIVRIEPITAQKILIFTKDHGVYFYNVLTEKLQSFHHGNTPRFPAGEITYMGVTNKNELWFEAVDTGVYQLNLQKEKISHLKALSLDASTYNTHRKSFLLTAPNGTVWIQPHDGALSYWNPVTNQLSSIAACMKGNTEEVSDVMYTAMFDALGNLWFCSFKQGLDLLVFNNTFTKLDLDQQDVEKKFNVRSIMQDANKTLWVASRSKKITLLDERKNVIGVLGTNGKVGENSSDWGADVYHMMQDTNGNVWIGTRGNGLFCLQPTKQQYHYKVKHYKATSKKYSISSNHIYNIFQASNGVVYVATWGGGINIVEKEGSKHKFIHYNNELKKYPISSADRVRTIVEDKEGTIFFITPYELYSFPSKKKENKQLEFTKYPQVLGSDIIDALVTADNKLALATNGRGVLLVDIKEKEQVDIYCPLEEMIDFPIEGIMAIEQDHKGNLWMMGENQVVRYHATKKEVETFPELKSIIGTDIISEASKCRLQNGEIVIGYSNGVICFNPTTMKPLDFKPHLSISNFTINNKKLQDVNNQIQKNPDMLQEITLNHDQNFFRIHLSALDFIKNENIVYRYKLEGVEEQWNYFKGAQSINYTNLSKGKYQLLLSSTNSHNLWVDNERRLQITILPSVWNTRIAYLCYVLIAVVLFVLIQRTIVTILKLRNDVHMEKQMAELKLKFFTDISHEIRTPLTMITAPVEKMIADEEVSVSVKKQLKVIERNSNRLLNLVNQILDLRRIQNRKLDIREVDLNDFVFIICENFKELSIKRKIGVSFNIPSNKTIVWADIDGLDKILVNLMSNAFKYCREGDQIEVVLAETEKNVILKIIDNGPGISNEVQKRLFMRFSNYNINPSNPSTGIGLSIVKGLVDKHGASISVQSELGKGTCFELHFIKGYEHYNEDVDIVFKNVDEEVVDTLLIEEKEIDDEIEKNNAKKVGVVVEDDKELRAFMVAVLDKDYLIYEAENGLDGYHKIKEKIPDFVVSDIMMPKMDGIELLKIIRDHPETSHLPFILLSAKTSIESRLEGMEYGADEYLTKPFNVSYLRARVKNILEQRKRLQKLYSSGNIQATITSKETQQISNQDHQFMLDVIKLVEEHIMKTDFSVEELGSLMNMSRASFFNKLKALSGVSPVKFIRNMRLKKAAELIVNEDLLIKEVCFQVGFNDLKYFGKCFKATYNCTPAEYRNLQRNKN